MNVYFTVDTESSMAGAWNNAGTRPLPAQKLAFCRSGDSDSGVGLLTRILGEFGFRATYFVETLLAAVNGPHDLAPVFEYLLKHRQDVQLHLHPSYHFFSASLRAQAEGKPYRRPDDADFIGAFPEAQQVELLSEAIDYFRRLAGFRPVAFRAGCFAANRATLRALASLGLTYDSSYNPCYPAWSFAGEQLEPNRVTRLEGVWEFPVTVARTPLPESQGGLKHADPSVLSVAELKQMLEAGSAAGQRHFVILFHSFSATKSRDISYSQMRPDRVVVARLRQLAEYLAHHPDKFRVTTFSDLTAEGPLGEGAAPVANLGLVTAGIRKFVQGVNRLYWV